MKNGRMGIQMVGVADAPMVCIVLNEATRLQAAQRRPFWSSEEIGSQQVLKDIEEGLFYLHKLENTPSVS